jgi:DNA-directed RNA polymerase specialized sigma24 family protein
MNELKKSNINHLVSKYHKEKDEAQLVSIYRDLLTEYQPRLDYWSATTTFLSGEHDMQAIFDDRFMTALKATETNGGDFVKYFHRSLSNGYKSLLRNLGVRRRYEQYETENSDDDSAKVEVASEYSTEEEVIEKFTAKQKDDQRQLIDFLVRGENERTTAIVQAFLTTDLKTPTAIGKYLGLDHKQVSRALTRLAAKYSTKQFGNYTDYLIAL